MITQKVDGKQKAIGLMVICSVMWSTAGIFIKLIPWNPFVIAGFRSFFAACIVVIYMAVKKIPVKVNRSSILSGVLLGCTLLCFVVANKTTTAANAIVLQFTAPVFVMLFSAVVYHQKFKRTDLIVVLVTMLGISLCFVDQLEMGGIVGNGIAVLSGVFIGGMYVATGNTDFHSRISGILFGQLITAVVGIPFVFVSENPVSPEAVISIVILGVFQLGIPYILYGIAVVNCAPLVCCLISAIEPLLNPLWVFLFNGEAPGMFALIGGIVVIISITLWNIHNNRLIQGS